MSAIVKKISFENNNFFLSEEIISIFTKEVASVVKSISGFEVINKEPYQTQQSNEVILDYSVLLNVNSNLFKGEIYFHFDQQLATYLIKVLTNEQVVADSKECLDGIGELSNMFYGAIKTKLSMKGFSMNLSIPKASKSCDRLISISLTKSLFIPVEIQNNNLIIEIVKFLN